MNSLGLSIVVIKESARERRTTLRKGVNHVNITNTVLPLESALGRSMASVALMGVFGTSSWIYRGLTRISAGHSPSLAKRSSVAEGEEEKLTPETLGLGQRTSCCVRGVQVFQYRNFGPSGIFRLFYAANTAARYSTGTRAPQ
ncbi:hypothetical protein DSL72_007459 [Monilinia vaccinii-corymbosi]|uniref:Uncharacterized protein n=1 Tax=Monilinia vaccinii-corymbosi TaxID=61207 RepID=A0A8A3PMV2_9HELO|nr:hypothetical protein DSL72_007459 [Monilinia vaccinii-corymbosi]